MIPRSVCLFVEDGVLRDWFDRFFVAQGWDVDVTGPNDLLVFDSPAGIDILRSLRKRRDYTPGLIIKRVPMKLRGLKFAIALEEPFTPDRVRDACGTLLRRRIKLVLKRRAS